MNYLIIFIVILIILIIIYTTHYCYLIKNNNDMEILESNKVSYNELNTNLRNKLPLIITGEIEDWFIFKENDEIDDEKLTNDILLENSKKLFYPLSLKKYIKIINIKKNNNINIIKEKNTRHFIGVLKGKISVLLFNPNEYKNFENKKGKSMYNFYKHKDKFNKVKYNEIILNEEKLLYIPLNWWYCYNVLETGILLNISSESLITYPLLNILNKK